MLKKRITYTDYNGIDHTEDFYFNLTKTEALEMELGTTGGLSEKINKIIAANDMPTIVAQFKELILKAYGEKSEDGIHFVKNDKVRELFSQTEAFSNLFIELATDTQAATDFVNGIIPKA